nr:hypothetical protein [Tanacetum cinerariifolium]
MNSDSAHMMAASKVSMLKPGEFEIWRMRIEQYIQMMDYALWDVIKNGSTLSKTQVVEGVTTVMHITSVEDKAQRRLEVKAKSTLMIGIPNEHQLKFNSIKDAKQPIEAIENRFEWNTHAVVWRNKADVDTMSMDDLYNNLMVYELEVKGMSSSSTNTQNMAFVSSSNNNSTNGSVNTAQAVNTAIGVSTAGTQVNTANINNLSDDVICAFLASQPSSPQLVNEDLEHIHPDDLEEMNLKWQMAMLTIRARSEQAEEGPNFAFVAYTSSSSDSKVSTDSTCTKSCLETVKILKSKNEQLTKDLKKSEFMVLGYKTGLESVEERLKLFKTNESVYLVDMNVLKVEIQMKDIAIKKLRMKLELAQKEKDNIQLTVDKLENASKSLNKLIDFQIVDNCKKGLGYENYNGVSPPYTGNFMPLKPDLSFTGLDEFANKPVVENSKVESSQEKPKEVGKNTDAPIIEEWVSDDEDEEMIQSKFEQKIVKTSIAKIKFVKPKQVEKKARKTV